MGVRSVLLFLFLVATIANDKNKAAQKDTGCDLEQKGFHLKLRCSLTPKRCGNYDSCYLGLDIARDAYLNPYEVADKLPELKFTITRRALRGKGRLLSLFSSKNSTEYESIQEIAMNASEIDIEAPSWKSESNRWRFSIDTLSSTHGSNEAIELSIPLHLRYSPPSRTGKPKGGFVAKAMAERCEAFSSDLGVFSGQYSMGCSSDLLLVLPLTVLLLVIGMLIMALH